MDSLRYWLTEMQVDGFRFDLAPTLARQEGGFDHRSAFFDLVNQDPVVSQAKVIAEPWDVGQFDSYDIGRFPPLWREWNGKYRGCMRDFWRSHDGLIGEFANRFSGSSDIYGGTRRGPTASVNFITVHDGFTLADLVSYDNKHNEADDGSMLVDDDFLVLVNAWWEPLAFTIPPTRPGQQWHTEVDTFEPNAPVARESLGPGSTITIGPRSVVVLRAAVASPV